MKKIYSLLEIGATASFAFFSIMKQKEDAIYFLGLAILFNLFQIKEMLSSKSEEDEKLDK